MLKKAKSLIKKIFPLIKESLIEFNKDKVLKLSAALAYYTVFSLVPMLVVIVGLCGIFLGKDAVQGQIFYQIDQFVGPEAAFQIQETLKKTALIQDNFIATIVGFITLLFGATGMFGEVQDSINIIWGLKIKPQKGFFKIMLNRLTSFSMVLILGFLLLVSLTFSTLMSAFLDYLKSIFSVQIVNYLYSLDYLVALGIVSVLFAFIFKVLPDAKIKWKDVWMGALVTSFLFLLGKFWISYYLENNASITTYGAAGSVVAILLWVYYSSIILYFGAEFTQVYVRHRGRLIEANKYAVWVEGNSIERKYNTQINKSTQTRKQIS